MELLLILGLLAIVVLAAVGLFLFLQQRRSGTIRAVVPPRRQRADGGTTGDGSSGTEQ
ncbi:MAG TPA: hypothetical protein VMP67_09625 [Candidatus Limnocylindria bacterium]|nr:hypothetical protein [Candidatus Limnocylindria bacterium]